MTSVLQKDELSPKDFVNENILDAREKSVGYAGENGAFCSEHDDLSFWESSGR